MFDTIVRLSSLCARGRVMADTRQTRRLAGPINRDKDGCKRPHAVTPVPFPLFPLLYCCRGTMACWRPLSLFRQRLSLLLRPPGSTENQSADDDFPTRVASAADRCHRLVLYVLPRLSPRRGVRILFESDSSENSGTRRTFHSNCLTQYTHDK